MDELERRESARNELARRERDPGALARPRVTEPGAYELADIDDVDDSPSPMMRRRRLIVGIVAVVAIVALALTAIGVGSIVFLFR